MASLTKSDRVENAVIEISAGDVVRGMAAVISLAANANRLGVLVYSSVLIRRRSENIEFVATDGHAIAVMVFKAEKGAETWVRLSETDAKEIARQAKRIDKIVRKQKGSKRRSRVSVPDTIGESMFFDPFGNTCQCAAGTIRLGLGEREFENYVDYDKLITGFVEEEDTHPAANLSATLLQRVTKCFIGASTGAVSDMLVGAGTTATSRARITSSVVPGLTVYMMPMRV